MSINPVFSNSYYSKFQLEQLGQADGQAGSGSSDSLALNPEIQDTVKFSENALIKLQETAGNMNGESQDFPTPPESQNPFTTPGALPSREQYVELKDNETGREVSSATQQQTIDSIRKQIAEVKKQLQSARERLQEIQMKLEQAKAEAMPQAGGDSPEAASRRLQLEAEGGGSEAPDTPAVDISGMEAATEQMINVSIVQTEMQSVAQEIKTLNGQLMSLNNKLVEAMEEVYGAGNGPPGAAGGTRAGGGMGGSVGGAGFRGINIGV